MGHLVIDVVGFVLFCASTVVLVATRRGTLFAEILYLSAAILMLGGVVDQLYIIRLLPLAWQVHISYGLIVLWFLIVFLGGILATTFRRRQPQ